MFLAVRTTWKYPGALSTSSLHRHLDTKTLSPEKEPDLTRVQTTNQRKPDTVPARNGFGKALVTIRCTMPLSSVMLSPVVLL